MQRFLLSSSSRLWYSHLPLLLVSFGHPHPMYGGLLHQFLGKKLVNWAGRGAYLPISLQII